MAELTGQLDGFDYPRNTASKRHNLGDMPKKGTHMKGQNDKSRPSNQMPEMDKPSVRLNGQLD